MLRPLALYHAKSLGWAGPAEVAGDNGHPNSRNCPATDLSISMGTELLKAFVRTGGPACWYPDPASFSKVRGMDYYFTRDDMGRQGHRTRRLNPPALKLLRHDECTR